MDSRKASLWLGIVLTAMGILGFIPGITQSNHLFGLFHVGVAMNLLLIVTGLIAMAASQRADSARSFFKTAAVVYAILGVWGLFEGSSGQILGFLNHNGWDVALDFVVAAFSAYEGWARDESRVPAGRQSVAFGEYRRDRNDRR